MIAPSAPKSGNAKRMVHKLMQQKKQLTRHSHSSSWLVGPSDKENGEELRKIKASLQQEHGSDPEEFEYARYRRLQTKRFSIDLAKVNNQHKLLAKPERIALAELSRQLEEESRRTEFRMDLSFSGAGFMGCYYFGVVNCWNKYIPRERVRRVAGASAGSLIAAYYLIELPLESALAEIIDMMEDVRRRPLGVFDRSNQIVDVLPARLEVIFPEDAHKRVSGRLFVSMTRLKDMKNVIVNEFHSKQELIEALNCSCFIPVWSGNHVPTFRGVKHIDGGFTNNLPVFDEHTVRVCCFSGASDIAPSDGARLELLQGSVQGMPFHWSWANLRRAGRALWPPPPGYVVDLLERGFHDAKHFILANDLIQCDACFAGLGQAEPPAGASISPRGQLRRAGSAAELRAPQLEREPEPEPAGAPERLGKLAYRRRPSQAELLLAGSPSEKFIGGAAAKRRNTRAHIDTGRLQQDLAELQARLSQGGKFSPVPETLPSCPPSPSLNRRCAACIRLRQEARADAIDEAVREQADKYRALASQAEPKPPAPGARVRRRLSGPLRWVRHRLASRESYSFGAPDAPAPAAARAERRRSEAVVETVAF